MTKENKIMDFNDLYNQESQRTTNESDPQRKGSYRSAIFIYLFGMFFLSAILFLIFSSIDTFTNEHSENELLIDKIALDVQGLAVLEESAFEPYLDAYSDYVKIATTYQGYVIIVNAYNMHYKDLFFTIDSTTEEHILNEDVLLTIFQEDNPVTYWNDKHLEIHLYAGGTQILPDFFETNYEVVTGPETKLSKFAFSLLNFSIYLFLLPPLLFILRYDIQHDFNKSRLLRHRWLFIIGMGYLLLIAANVFSNLVSTLLGSLMGQEPTTAVNQIVIMQALRSDGAILMAVTAVIMGPIVEEFIFRKAIFGFFKKDITGLIVSTLLFGSIHLLSEPNLTSALINGTSYFLMGGVFGFIYLKSGKNIFAPILVHMLSNLIAIVAIIFFL